MNTHKTLIKHLSDLRIAQWKEMNQRSRPEQWSYQRNKCEIHIIDVEQCVSPQHLCSIWGIKRLPNTVWSPFSLQSKIAVECQSICTWLVWAFPFILNQKEKNLIAERSNGELSTRLHMQFDGGNVCLEHKDIGPLDGCPLLGSRSSSHSNIHHVFVM